MKTPELLPALILTSSLFSALSFAAAQDGQVYNTVKSKLITGQQVVGGTVETADPDIYCAMANAGFDFIWIEMQHSPLSFSEAAKMIWACRDAPAIPFIRVPDANEGTIQKAADIGALGIIVPMVDGAEKMADAVRYAKYPPQGRRSQGGGQYGRLWGRNYRQTWNDNVIIIAMIETLEGTAEASSIAAVEGVDGVFVASGDLGSFSGKRQGEPEYELLVSRIKEETENAGKFLGGPSAWMSERNGYQFFQAPSTSSLIRIGARLTLEEADPCRFLPAGATPVDGENACP
ncbi:MAG TPA: hypothetical protein DEF79_01105 [Gammaproteobacteria bacterium]|nr:hypothetical protein [Gammaproteobacteria bacterium]|tara:strand:- start:3732 stop:4601 length:870 start_codon:yes stop_codon:yes gene_type:complete